MAEEGEWKEEEVWVRGQSTQNIMETNNMYVCLLLLCIMDGDLHT